MWGGSGWAAAEGYRHGSYAFADGSAMGEWESARVTGGTTLTQVLGVFLGLRRIHTRNNNYFKPSRDRQYFWHFWFATRLLGAAHKVS